MSDIRALIIMALSLLGSYSFAASYTYCIPNNQIDFNPFREIKDGKDLAYLMFTRPYISTNVDEDGLLSAYEFSPSGHVFRGKIHPSAKWSNGSVLTPYDAAVGIIKGFSYRPIGSRVKANTPGLNSQNWHKKQYSGIKIIDANTFEIHFLSKIDNLTGVIREALSTNSRHNRVWPIQLNEYTNTSFIPNEVIGLNKLKLNPINKTISFVGDNDIIKIISEPNCNASDMSLYLNLYDAKLEMFDFKQNPAQQAALAVLNTKTLGLKVRREMANWLRHSCEKLPDAFGMKLAQGLFLKNEPGYSEKNNWGTHKFDLNILRKHSFSASAQIPIYKEILERAAKKDGLKISFEENKTKEIDFQIISTAVIKGRLVFLQDYLKWPFASKNFLNHAPLTKKALQSIAAQSAATMPPDNITLQKFEAAVKSEHSIVPLVRRNTLAFSRKSSPFQLTWTSDGDLRIRHRETK